VAAAAVAGPAWTGGALKTTPSPPSSCSRLGSSKEESVVTNEQVAAPQLQLF